MATIGTHAAKLVGIWGYPGIAPEIRRAKEGASETFKKGMFLVDDTAGRLQAVTSDSTADVVGMAARDGQNNASEGAVYTEFYPLVVGSLLEMNALEASDAAHVSVLTDLWAAWDYQLTGTTVSITGDQGAGTSMLLCVGLDLGGVKGVLGDTNARMQYVPFGSLLAITPDA